MGILCSNYDRDIRYKKIVFKHCSKCGVRHALPHKFSRERKGCSIHLFNKKGICKHCHLNKNNPLCNCIKCYHV